MNGLGYYTMTEPMVDTYMTPFPIAFPDEDVAPVPGWGMNPMLAGPYWIAVGDSTPVSTPASTMLKRYVVAPLVVGGVVYFAARKKRGMYAAIGALGALLVGSALEKAGA
jgi:hypothetical protein